jgi:hypothetical protein
VVGTFVGWNRCAVVAALAASVLGCGARETLPTGAAGCPRTWFLGDQSGAVTVALDETYAYWTTSEMRLQRGSLATGAVDDLTQLTSWHAIVRSVGDWLLVADDTRILRMSKQDGSFEVLATNESPLWRFVADADGIYVLDEQNDGGLGNYRRLARWSPGGGFEVLRNYIYYAEIALDADNLYLAAQHSQNYPTPDILDAVLQIDRVTDAYTVIAEKEIKLPFGIQVHGTRVVVGNLEGNILESWLHIYSGGSSSRVSLEDTMSRFHSGYNPTGLALDEADVYVSAKEGTQGSRLVKVPLAGGAPEIALEIPEVEFQEPAVSATHVAVPMQHTSIPLKTGDDFANVIVFCK